MSAKFVKFTALALTCSMLLCTAVSCGKNNKNSLVLRTYSTFGAEDDLSAYSEIISDFTQKNKNVIINDTTTDKSNSYKMELSISSTYKGSNSPDIIYTSVMSDMSELGDYFVSVDEIRKDYPNFASGISEAVLDSVAADDGVRYCIPVRGDWQGIVVNAALFRRSALKIPETWDDIITAANNFKNSSVYLFANALDDSSALMEYLVRGLGGESSLRSAMSGNPDSTWKRALDAISELDKLNVFPSMSAGLYDNLVSPSDLKHTVSGDEKTSSAVELYNSGKAAILIIDNSMCGQINSDIDSSYIILPSVDTFSGVSPTTSASTTTTATGAVTLPSVRSTLPITPPNQASSSGAKPRSGSGESTTAQGTKTTQATQGTKTAQVTPSDVSPSDDKPEDEQTEADIGFYVNFSEGFYITKKAYYDEEKREYLMDFINFFLEESRCIKFCGNYRVPALSSISSNAVNSLTEKSNIYNAVINSVQSAKSFVTTTQTQENSFFWNHCEMAIAYMSKGILSKDKAIKLIADTQSTVADIYKS